MVAATKKAKEQQPEHLGTRSVGVRLSEVLTRGLRLEASSYALEARQAVAELHACRHPTRPLLGEAGLVQRAHNGTRFNRVYVGEERGVPFLSSSDIIGLRPERGNYLSRKHTPKLSALLIEPWMVLVSRSGTVGNVGLASPRMAGWALSEDAIRIIAEDTIVAGYVAAFLRSRWGRAQLKGLTYGSVIQHIEPHHLSSVLIPELPNEKLYQIGSKFVLAATKRDEANLKLDKADEALRAILALPDLPTSNKGPVIGTVKASRWNGRLDATFHTPLATWIGDQLKKAGVSASPLRESQWTREIRAVTKFRKRVYVNAGGIPLLSSKQLFQVDPIEQSRLAKGAHEDDLDEIALEPNMVAVTCSGTIGRVQIIPEYMRGWAANQHALRIIGKDAETAGYLYCWLSSRYGQILLQRYSYGSVILELDRHMASALPIPEIGIDDQQRIGASVLARVRHQLL